MSSPNLFLKKANSTIPAQELHRGNPMPAAPEPGKPRLALAAATALGLGYFPKAPGTFGSAAGVLLGCGALYFAQFADPGNSWLTFAAINLTLVLAISILGVWAAGCVAIHLHKKDPQIVVIDEVAGQLIAYFGLATAGASVLNWKFLLLGFILFRVFDIWKPFPARQAESLPGGLGIMADDWVAGIYAAFGLWFARHLGL